MGVFLTCFGFYCLFAPVIKTLAWIPLLGSLLSNLTAVAAMLFSGVVGTILGLLTIASAWVFYRPIIACMLLLNVAFGLYIIFFFGSGFDPEFIGEAGEVVPDTSDAPETQLESASKIMANLV